MTSPADLLKWALLALSFALASCSGSDSQVAGIEGTGGTVSVSATGSITGFGSVYVNGNRYLTEGADIFLNGELAPESALEPGMVVTVEAEREGQELKVATIQYADVMRGTITAVEHLDAVRAELQVLNQTVVVSDDAAFSGLMFEDLQPGMTVAISGFTGPGGVYLASRIARADDDDLNGNLAGAVTAVDPVNAFFSIGALNVDYSQAIFAVGAVDDLAVGVAVSVHGRLTDTGVLQAKEVRIDARQTAAGQELSVEGVIANYDSSAAFILNGLPVDVSNARLNRVQGRSLAPGARIAIAGQLSADGVLVANSLTLLLPGESRLRGTIDSIDASAGKLQVLDLSFSTDDFTVYEDKSAAANRHLAMDGFNTGDTVEVHGRDLGGQWVATRVTRVKGEGVVSIKGPLGRLEDHTATVMGLNIDLTSAVGVDALSGLRPGSMVTVEGVRTGPRSLVATRVLVHESASCAAPVNIGCGTGKAGPQQ